MRNLTKKQRNALYYLRDKTTTEILFGGGAGGGKSALGCLWLIEMCQTYPATRWVMGRSKLKALKETTLNTFFELSSKLNISNQFIYNAQSGIIRWDNGSEIILKDLFLYPSDPQFDSLGSLEITGGFVDECNQITYKAWQILKSRIRYKLDEFDLSPKLLGSCNPAKNWVYTIFYKPFKNGLLDPSKMFIQSLLSDNPHISKHYKQNLLTLDKNSKARLLFGDWEYDDNPNALCDYDSIVSIFENDHVPGGDKYLTCDVARFGSDKAVVGVWDGWKLIEVHTFDISKTTDIQACIIAMRSKHQISKDRCVADADGVGGGVVDSTGIKGFTNNARPMKEQGKAVNYRNLQTQCLYHLADRINNRELYIETDLSQKHTEEIIEELEQIRSKEKEMNKLDLISKDEIKDNIGRSPDFRDMLLMRVYFDLKPPTRVRSSRVA